MEQERKRLVGDVIEDEVKATIQRKQSIKSVDLAMERERTRRVTGKEPPTMTNMLVFGLAALALIALVVLTFEDKITTLLAPPPPPPPPPRRGFF